VQFQSGGDPRTGAVVSAQEAQAQAILQQTKVHKHAIAVASKVGILRHCKDE